MDIYKILTDAIYPVFKIFVVFLNVVAVLILMYGSFLGIKEFISSKRSKISTDEAIISNQHIKNHLASYILLSLEVLIASDIIESVIHPTLQDLFKLGFLVVIRTAISFFLNKEIEEES
ncbi:DUF1622 domain-containing protein [Floricoccus penangensis]|uniref:DUF1622 domain-containing protein n=1 Tax=Floricoccus penangensis TaxID=1859475 RepID=A0A9Q5NZ02_9LACT|nr:DUF1622 domain-containing protein [Floricoccus penangensis]OFI45948.1 hypothetical protein BG262_06645 [Floricoccus penangensis]URZ87589.1 DUF1622 domain-containing protein [Floricoccus penangensis]